MWIAIAIGVYIVVISISGSAVVFRRELGRTVVPRTVPAAVGVALTGESLDRAVRATYSDYEVLSISEPRRPERPVYVSLSRNNVETQHLFDQYASTDLGDTYPLVLRLMEWLVDLHDNLLVGQTGRLINGVGGGLTVLLVMTGAIIWWPGRGRWRHSLVPKPAASSRSLSWHLHSALGIWSLVLLLIWGATAVYFAFPRPFEAMIDYLDADPTDFERPEGFLLFLIKLHFGRFGGLGVRTTWVILGLLPVVMFITGFIVWWKRVVVRRWRTD